MSVGRLPDGAASLVLAPGLAFLDEPEAVFTAMLEGWRAQQLGRHLRASTIRTSTNAVERFRDSAVEYPWLWSAGLFDEWMSDLVGVKRLAPSTIRSYQHAVR